MCTNTSMVTYCPNFCEKPMNIPPPAPPHTHTPFFFSFRDNNSALLEVSLTLEIILDKKKKKIKNY